MPRFISTVALSAALGIARPVAPQAPIKVSVIPERPLIERDDQLIYLNFDFSLENPTDSAISIERVELSVFDPADRLVRQQFVWSKGAASPAFLTVPDRTIAPKKALGLFNPFYALPAGLRVGRLHYRFILGMTGLVPTAEVAFDVRPIEYRSRTRLTLPVDGPALVYDGHDFYSHHRRIPLGSSFALERGLNGNPVRYANDWSPVGPNGELAHGPLSEPTNWYAYGAVVRAPAAGVVVSSGNDLPDNRIENGQLVTPPGADLDNIKTSMGNHVIIKHADGEFSSLAHLKAGSVLVKTGDHVKEGQAIGQIGFSGDTGFHVHVHHMLVSEPDFKADGLPSYFDRVRRVSLPQARSRQPGPTLLHARVDTGDLVEAVR